MDYFRILDLKREPFSNSPEPESFYAAPQYAACLQHLELAVRLRRGLNVVIGDIGVGKSTLCRQLILRLSAQEEDRQQIETHLIMDPAFGVPREFLSTVAVFLGLPPPDAKETDWQIKEQIKNLLFKKGVDEKKIVVLIIDEGQKLPDFCRELLREFLNYETNEYKLLQIIIFAQPEFAEILNTHANFADRINHHGFLGPMSAKETAEMIRYRIMKASSGVPPVLFTHWGLRAIHRATGGYPRKVITLCHQLVLAMIIKERAKAGWFLVRSSLQTKLPGKTTGMNWTMPAIAGALLVLFVAFMLNMDNLWQIYTTEWQTKPEAAVSARVSAVPHDAAAVVVPPPALPVPPPPPLPISGDAQTSPPGVKKEIPPAMKGAAKVPVLPPDATVRSVIVQSVRSLPASTPGRTAAPSPPAPKAAPPVASPPAAKAPPAIPPPPLASSPAPESPGEVPKMLGQLPMRKDGSVLRMMRKIYGSEDLSHLKAIARVNPQIDNINVVSAGRTVTFPALPISGKPSPKKTYRLQIAKHTDLKGAYSFLELYPPDLLAIHLVPYWNSREGLVFAVLLKEGFPDEAAALRAKSQLLPSLGTDAEIRDSWDKDTVFFARP